MNLRNFSIVLALALVLSAFVIPMTESDASVTENDVVIQIPELKYDSEKSSNTILTIDLPNSGSTSYTAYITNNSSSMIAVVFWADDNKYIDVTGTNIDVAAGDIGKETLTFKAAADAPSGRSTVEVHFTITSLGTESNSFDSSIAFDVVVESGYYSDEAYNCFFGFLPNNFSEPLNGAWFPALVTLIAYMVVSWMLCVIIIPLLMRALKSRVTSLEKKKLTKSITKMVEIIIFVYSLNVCAQILGLGPNICHMLSAVSTFVYVCVAAAIVWRVFVLVISSILKEVDDAEVSGLDSSLLPLFKMIGKIIISVVSAAVILAAFGVDLAGILMSAGVITLGITLGAQNTLNQFFSGIVLLSTRPFKKGDFVNINGDVYIVRKVKLMFTEFENWDKDKIITIPNNVVSGATIVNMKREEREISRIFIYMSVAYEADQTRAKDLMLKAAGMHPHVIQDEEHAGPGIRLTNFLDSGIEYRLACYVDSFDNNGHYAGQIREIIFKLFKDEGIEIPYNKMEITLMEPCDGKKREDDDVE